MTFRLRLTLWYSALVMTIIAIFGIGSYLLLQRVMLQQADDTLVEVVDEVKDSLYVNVFPSNGTLPPTTTFVGSQLTIDLCLARYRKCILL